MTDCIASEKTRGKPSGYEQWKCRCWKCTTASYVRQMYRQSMTAAGREGARRRARRHNKAHPGRGQSNLEALLQWREQNPGKVYLKSVRENIERKRKRLMEDMDVG